MILSDLFDIGVLIFYGFHLLLQECFVISHTFIDGDLCDGDCVIANDFALALDAEDPHSLNGNISLVPFPSD